MSHEIILEAINQYLEDNLADGAIFINGSWGSGKTFFINNIFLLDYKKRHPKANYGFISLNGKINSDDISRDLFFSFHKLLAKWEKSTFAKGIKKLLANIKFKDLSLNFSDFLLVNSELKEHIDLLIFDDIERCRLPICQTLGLISDLAVKLKSKVIIVGNEKEIIDYLSPTESFQNKLISAVLLKNDKAFSNDSENSKESFDKFVKSNSEPSYYLKIKEKVVWKTIFFNFDDSTFFDEIIKDIDDDIHELLVNNRQKIASICRAEVCENFRIYKAALENFIGLKKKYDSLDLSFLPDKKDFESKILLCVFFYTLESRIPLSHSGDLSWQLIIQDLDIKTNFTSVQRYSENSSWNPDLFMKECLLLFKNEGGKNNLPKELQNLRYVWALKSDEDVKTDYLKMVDAYKHSEIPIDYLDEVYYFSWLYSVYYGFKEEIRLDDLYEQITETIKGATSIIHPFDFSYSGMAMDDECKSRINSIFTAYEEKNRKLQIRDFESTLSDPTAILSDEKLRKIKSEALNDKCFISKIDVSALVDKIRYSNNKAIDNIRYLFNTVYGFSNIDDFFQSDKETLREFEGQLKSLIPDTASQTKKILIEWFDNDVVGYINKLSKN